MRRAGGVALAATVLIARVALAGEGTLSGRVTNSEGDALENAVVTVAGSALQGERRALTRKDGSFLVAGLPPGTGYRALVTYSGFRTQERTNLAIRAGSETRLVVRLDVSLDLAELVITGEAPLVDVTRAGTSEVFDADFLRRTTVGAGSRTYLAVLQEAPGVIGTGNASVLGSLATQSSYTVDGLNTTDAVTHTFGANLSFDSIEELTVRTSSFLAEHGRATGGVVSVVTKSGGNVLAGSLDARVSPASFQESGGRTDARRNPASSSQVGATLGGPFVKDRLWFFASVERPERSLTPSTGDKGILAQNPEPPSRDYRGTFWSTKLTFRPSENVSGTISAFDHPTTISGVESSPLVRPEAASTQKQGGPGGQARADVIVSADGLLSAWAGRSEVDIDWGPSSGDASAARWLNAAGGRVAYDGASSVERVNRPRASLGLAGTLFLSGLGGTHQVKAGLEGERVSGDTFAIVTGAPSDPAFCPWQAGCGAAFEFAGFDPTGARVPYLQTVTEKSPGGRVSGRTISGYVQDQWRLGSRLTANAGLRLDLTAHDDVSGRRVADFASWQPRLSLAWDATGDGRTVARAAWGRFYDEPGLSLAENLPSGRTSPRERVYLWDGAAGAWSLAKEAGGGPTDAAVDPDLRPAWEDHLHVGIEREVARGVALSAGWVRKRAHDLYADSCADASCSVKVLTNRPGGWAGAGEVLSRSWDGLLVEGEARTDRARLLVSWTWSMSRGSVDGSGPDGSSVFGASFDRYPENFVNASGWLANDARNVVKANGVVRLPAIETDLSVAWLYRSGLAYSIWRYDPLWGPVLSEPRGSRRTASFHTLDVQLEKSVRLPLGSGLSASLVASVLNLLDREAPLSYGTIAGRGDGTPLTWQRPRSWQLGVRLDLR